MKKVRINAGKVGLVFRNGDYQKVITAGTYWLRFSQNVMEFNLVNEFIISFVAKEVLLKDAVLAEMLEIVEVKDTELVLVYENKNFKRVLILLERFFR